MPDVPILHYAVKQPPTARRLAAAVLLAVSAGLAAGLAWEFTYRLVLYLQAYSATPGLNHVADGVFGVLYACGSLGVFCALAGAWMCRRRRTRLLACALAAANLAVCMGIHIMHRMGALVEYSEFAKTYGP